MANDSFERQKALNPEKSFIVQAPAGSGKTELLMQRFLVLLAAVNAPESILAMTFTRKAASEMRSRIIKALADAGAGVSPETEHEKKTLELARHVLNRDAELDWGLLKKTGRLNIRTIDSLCASLVRQMPLISRMGKAPSVEEYAEELYAEAALRVISLVEEDGADGDCVRSALRHLDNSVFGLTQRLCAMLARRDQWLRHVKAGEEGREGLRTRLEASFKKVVEHELEKALLIFPRELEQVLLSSARHSALNAQEDSLIKNLDGIFSLPEAKAKDLRLWKGIRTLLITSDGKGWRKPNGVNVKLGFSTSPADASAKKAFKKLLEDIETNDNFFQALNNASGLPEPEFSDEDWDALRALLKVLRVAEAGLKDVFAASGSADFQEIAMSALGSLGPDDNPTDLMLALDLSLGHILVDEYQDTSYAQCALLMALTRGWTPGDGRTLFVVGDPMQSIYGFREADVGLFVDAKNIGIGSVRLEPLTLKANFRSTAGIVDWVNSAFDSAFPMEEDALTGAISYAPSEAVKPGDGSQAVSVTLYKNRDDLAEAERVVQIIRETDRGETTAVLCRSRVQLGEVVKALKKEGIGFSAVDFDPLYATPAIQDLLALTRALCHPFDKTAWLAVLRAPWCGLSLVDLLAVAGYPDENPMPELLKDEARLTKLSHDGRTRLDGFMKKIEKAIYLKGRVGFRRLLEGAWTELGGPACAAYNASHADTEAFFDAVGSIGNSGGIDVQFLEERVKTLYADNEKAGASITLMTVHKAKGLEFDNVIIPGAGKRAKNEDKQLILWLERGADIFLAPVEKKDSDEPNPIYDYLRSFNKKKTELERTRLFYVACTRAKKRLYILGHAGLEYDADAGANFIKYDARSFLKSIESVLTENMYADAEVAAPPEPDTEQKPVLSLNRLPAGWALPTPANRITLDAEDKTVQLNIEPEFYWAGEMARHKGVAAHAYLCRIAREGLDKWGVERINRETGSIKAMLQSLGLGRDEAEKAAKEVADLLCTSICDDYGRWALGAHGEGAVEMPITGVIGGAAVHAVIDRTFVDSGVRWIIDYKTSAHEGGSVEGFIEREKERYRPQLERYEKLLRLAGETREIKKGLYYPALSKWAEL